MTKVLKACLCSLMALVALPAWGVDLTIPNTFTAGTPAVAAEVNANFTATATAVNSKQDKVSAAGVEFVNDGTITAIGTSDTTVATITVDAPVAGFLVANSMGSATCTNAASLTVRLHNTNPAVSTSAILGENRPTAGQVAYYSISYVFAANQGANTVTVTGNCTGAGGSMTVLTLNAIFVPNRY